MWLKVCVLVLCALCSAQSDSVRIEPFKSVFAVGVGSNLRVNCTGENSVKWTADPPEAMPSKADTMKGRAPGDVSVVELALTNITKSNAGTFFCEDGSTGNRVSFKLKVFSVMTQGATFEYKVDTMLECNVDQPDKTFTYSWSKGGTPVNEIAVEGKQGFISHPNGSLEILHPARRFAGVYTCTAQYTDQGIDNNITMEVVYLATPKVLPFDKSKNLVQDEKLVMVCEVLGYPKPIITWMKADQILENGKDGKESRYKLSSTEAYDGMTIENAKLEIESVDFDDGGEYVCMARQKEWPGFNSSQPILVRVKDKLAALWPFLGIVAEVVILCTIIFIYEKKRNKDAMIDDEDDQDGSTAEKRADSVRHRGSSSNNPRA